MATLSAVATSCPVTSHPTKVAAASSRTTGTKTALTRSASRWIGAFPVWAASTSAVSWARTVWAPTEVARTTSRPWALTVPPVTWSPTPTSTGTDSPVTIERSRALAPSTTTPSVATRSPGRTTKRSPTCSVAAGTTVSTPGPPARSGRSSAAVCGRKSASDSRASRPEAFARASSTRPRSRKVVTTAAVSKYRWPCSPPATSATSDHPYAARTPIDTSVSIVEAPCRAVTAAARWNGQAHHSATGVARTSWSHRPAVQCSRPIAMTTSGTVRTAATSSRGRSPRSSVGRFARAPTASGGSGSMTEAPYPVFSTVARRSPTVSGAANRTCACSVARLTVAATPSSRLSIRSTRAEHDAQVMPVMARSTSWPGVGAGAGPTSGGAVVMVVRLPGPTRRSRPRRRPRRPPPCRGRRRW